MGFVQNNERAMMSFSIDHIPVLRMYKEVLLNPQ